MRYENIETGAVLDSPFIITGDLWIPIDNPNQNITESSSDELKTLALEQQNKINELESEIEELRKVKELPSEEESEEAEPVEDEIDLQTLSNKQLEALAKEQGVVLTSDDKRNKETRITAIVTALG